MTTAIPADEIVFSTVPSLTTCSSATITWSYNATTLVTSFWPLVVTDVNIDQEGLSRRGYSLASRRSTTTVNMTLSTIHPSMGMFQWPNVNVSQGRYRLDVYAPARVMSSNVFNVTNGPDTSCLAGSLQSSTQPSSGTYISTSSSTSNPSTTPPITVPGGSVHKGLIAGTVVSGVAILSLIAAAALWVFRRRNATSPGSAPKTKGQSSKALHHQIDSTGAILPFVGRNQEFPQSSASEDDSHSEKTAVVYDHTKPSSPSIAATKTYSRSSLSSRRPVSMAVKPSFESRETIQSNMSRQTHRSLDSSAVRPNNTVFPSSSPSPPHPRYPTDRTRRASRKPVPVYDPNEFPGTESNGIPLSGRSEMGVLDRKQTFYLVPDPPLERRK